MAHLDGNVLAGRLEELLPFEPTVAEGRCVSCTDVAVLAQAAVYAHPMGFVVRCRRCDDILMVIVERDGRSSLSMRGLQWMAT